MLETNPVLPVNQSMREILILLSPFVGSIDKLSILKYALFDFFEQRCQSVSLCQNEIKLFTAILNGFTGVDFTQAFQFVAVSPEHRESTLNEIYVDVTKFKENIVIFNSMIQSLDGNIFYPWISDSCDCEDKLNVFLQHSHVLALYLKFIELCLVVLRNIHILWNPNLLSKFLSGFLHSADCANNFFHRAEFIKYVKGVSNPLKLESNLGTLQEHIKVEFWELSTLLYKILGDALRKNVVAFCISVSNLDLSKTTSPPIREFAMFCKTVIGSIHNIFHVDITYLDHSTFIQLIKYFVEPLCVDVAMQQIFSRNHALLIWFTDTMKLIFTHANFRLLVAYNVNNEHLAESVLLRQIKETGRFESETHFYYLLYQRCLIISSHQTESNILDSIRDGIISDLHRSIADILSTVIGNRGPLKVIIPNKSNLDQLTIEDIIKIERTFCIRYNFHSLFFRIKAPTWLQHSVEVVCNDYLEQSLLSCLLNVIRLPDSSASRTGLCLVETLLHYAVEDSSLSAFICKELNAQVLSMLLKPVS